MKISSDSFDREDSIKENSDEKSSDKENYNEEVDYRMCLFKKFKVTLRYL